MKRLNSIKIIPSTLTLELGKWYDYAEIEYCPEDAECKCVTWSSDDTSIAGVNPVYGYICGNGVGTTTVRATACDGSGVCASITVTVLETVPVSCITLNTTSIVMEHNERYTLKATVCPSNATNPAVNWYTSNSGVVRVCDGELIPVEKGTATVAAVAADGSGVQACCEVTVNHTIPISSISFNEPSKEMYVGDSCFFAVTVLPEDATTTYSYSSSNQSVATVDSKHGIVTAISEGEAYIIATSQDNGHAEAYCPLKVKKVVVEDTVPGLKTVKQCRVRKDMSMDDSAILKDANGTNVLLNVGDTVPLLSPTNDSEWYRILYNGMMLYVTNDGSFEEINVSAPTPPTGRTVLSTTEDVLNIRATPDTTKTALGQFSIGSELILTNETPQNEKWYAVYGQMSNGSYSYGWCSGEYIGENVTYAKSVYASTLTVRSSCSTSAGNLGTISKGDVVVLLEANCYNDGTYIWHKILYNDTVAYVVAELSVDTDAPNFDIYTEFVPLVTENNSDITETISQKEKIFAATVYAEAGGQNYRTKQAVAHVMNNRIGTRSGWSDIEAVVSAPYQFDGYGNDMYTEAINYYNSGSHDNTIEKNSMDECMEVIRPIYAGTATDITGGALYFHSYPNAEDWTYHYDYTLVEVEGTEGFWFYK